MFAFCNGNGEEAMKGKKKTRIALVECEDSEYVDIIEGPKELMDDIKKYLGQFYDYIEKTYFGDLADYDKVEHLVAYLNSFRCENEEKVRIISREKYNENKYRIIII